jgi:hypothetical protein
MISRHPRALTTIAALALALAPALLACSSEERRRSSSDDDETPPDPGPSGAVNVEIYATEAQSCPPGNIHVDMGNVKSAPPVTLEDGKDGASVVCAVVLEGEKLRASGAIKHGAASFGFSDVVSGGGSAIGLVELTFPGSGVRYATPSDKPCVFQFAPGSSQGIEPGKISVQFDCSSLVSESDAKDACSLRYGYILLEHCEGEPAE